MCQGEEVGVSERLNSPPSPSPSLRSRPATRSRHPTQWSSPDVVPDAAPGKGQKPLSFNRLQAAVLALPTPTLPSEHGHNARQREGSVLRGH